MASKLRPGCLVRSTLALLGILFLPLAVWFVYVSWRRYWDQSLALLVVGLLCLRLATSHKEDSWISMLDDLGGPANADGKKR